MTTMRARLTGILLVVIALTVPVAGTAQAGPPDRDKPVVGSRSLGDPLLPQLGNGGYDVRHYRIELDYDPAANHFDEARTTIRARATQTLSEFSLDFQDDLEVTRVSVGGRPAQFRFEDATPELSDNPAVTQPRKLVVTPHPSTRPKSGREFTVEVSYRGTPVQITDPDESADGWIRACYPLTAPQTCDGAFVVNEPMGVQSWYPSNNYPTDKATFDTLITVPGTKTAIGVGELASRKANRDGTTTWRWTEDDPTATYLTTATVGDFDLSVGTMTETSTRRKLPVYNAIDSSATPVQKAAIQASLDRAPGQVNFLSNLFGRYPFDSTGAVADRASGVGYALEVQTKPHYSGGFTSGNPSINIGTQAHELAHQWVGNSATLQTWSDIWFNEGWANWAEWWWQFRENGGDDPALVFDDLYENTPAEDWELAPAVLDGDPANMFAYFPTYGRGAMTVQGYREIVGDRTFFRFTKELLSRFEHDNISTLEFIAFAVARSGLSSADRALLRDYFEQWLYGETKPTILPEAFQ
jgi:aminopeptidase N